MKSVAAGLHARYFEVVTSRKKIELDCARKIACVNEPKEEFKRSGVGGEFERKEGLIDP